MNWNIHTVFTQIEASAFIESLTFQFEPPQYQNFTLFLHILYKDLIHWLNILFHKDSNYRFYAIVETITSLS